MATKSQKPLLVSGARRAVKPASPGPASKAGRRRIAFIDIETAPNLAYIWAKYEQDSLFVEKHWHLLTFAVKYQGDKKVYTYGLPDYPLYKRDPENDYALIKELWRVMDEADVIVAHNGDRFDFPKTNARFIYHGLTPPAPYKQVDTKKMAKSRFMFDSNKLDDLGDYLKVGRKMHTGGFGLWMGCMRGDKKSWQKMKEYNGQDVVLLEKIYDKFLPWAPNYPNANILEGTVDHCPRCGSDKIQKRGFGVSITGRTQKYQCRGCGGWCSGITEGTKRVIR